MAENTEELVTLTVSGIPETLVEQIDAIATAQSRSRSKQTMLLLMEIIEIKKTRTGKARAR